jgi:Kef-type K+ transport system membrane component KefB
VIHNLGGVADALSQEHRAPAQPNFGWLIWRPIVASAARGILLTPVLSAYLFSPLFRFYLEDRLTRFKHRFNIVLMAMVLCVFLSIANYAGASVLYGAFLASVFLSSLPCNHPDAPFMVVSRQHGKTEPGKTPTFAHTFEKYLLGARFYVLQPVSFAGMGFAIPLKNMWTGEAVWKVRYFRCSRCLAKVRHLICCCFFFPFHFLTFHMLGTC